MQTLSERSSRVVAYAKLTRAAARRGAGEFLVEGANAVGAALDAGAARHLLVRDGEQDRFADLLAHAAGGRIPVDGLTARAADKIADTSTTPGVFAVCGLLSADLDGVLAARPRLLACAVEIREPGNAGTLIRCADAMGADAVVLLGDCVDPHNGKCVRGSAGSIFHLPIVREGDIDGGLDRLADAGLVVAATAADGELALDASGTARALSGPVAWLFGNEAHGLPPRVAARADHRVRIPIRGRAESLNLAATAAICLYTSASRVTTDPDSAR